MKVKGTGYKPTWQGTENIDWNYIATRVRENRLAKGYITANGELTELGKKHTTGWKQRQRMIKNGGMF